MAADNHILTILYLTTALCLIVVLHWIKVVELMYNLSSLHQALKKPFIAQISKQYTISQTSKVFNSVQETLPKILFSHTTINITAFSF